jgi:hypothetical protein
MVIDDEDKARRLARAICADVMLYNAAVKDAPQHERAGLIAGPIAEGRALFVSRVSPRLAGLFEQEVAALIAGPLGIQLAASPTVPLSAGPVVVEAGGSSRLVIVVALFLAAAAAAFFLFRQ